MSIENKNIRERFPNWLPLPRDIEFVETPSVEEDDLFPKGEIVEFHERQGIGILENMSGKRYTFRLEMLELVGPKGHARYVKPGGRVGFDVARTKNGPQIIKLKVY